MQINQVEVEIMDLKDYIEFENENPACYLATADNDQPRVRGFLMWYADESGFYFHTGTPKSVCRQLQKNPKIEVCFMAPSQDPAKMKMMRLAGKVKFLDDLTLKTRLLEERPFLKAIGTGKPDDPLFAVFKIYTGEAHFWTMASNMRESEIEKIRF
jgi:pyridoxamine 5'-phosphate oxidase